MLREYPSVFCSFLAPGTIALFLTLPFRLCCPMSFLTMSLAWAQSIDIATKLLIPTMAQYHYGLQEAINQRKCAPTDREPLLSLMQSCHFFFSLRFSPPRPTIRTEAFLVHR